MIYRQTGGRTGHPKIGEQPIRQTLQTRHASTHYFVHLSHVGVACMTD